MCGKLLSTVSPLAALVSKHPIAAISPAAGVYSALAAKKKSHYAQPLTPDTTRPPMMGG